MSQRSYRPTKAYRDWPIDFFIELCRRLRADWPNAHFLVFGGAEERERTTALAAGTEFTTNLRRGETAVWRLL